jgi:hypothetical protein
MGRERPIQVARSEALQERLDQLPGRTRATLTRIYAEHGALQTWIRMVSEAASCFERRWTLAALQRVSPDIHGRLVTQCDLFGAALDSGSADDVALHGAAMVRGWRRAVEAMESANAPDDAYMIGQDLRTGLRVAIGEQKAAADRVRERYGPDVVWLSPDEAAMFLAQSPAFMATIVAKRAYPGAETVEMRSHYVVNHADEVGSGPGSG